MEEMKELLRQELDNGAFSMSLGLTYTSEDELAALFDVLLEKRVWRPVMPYFSPHTCSYARACDEILRDNDSHFRIFQCAGSFDR
jgi:hypothetical protein